MSGKSTNFDDKKINKSNFYKNKNLFNLHDIDANIILVSKKESYGTKNSLKYFIGYNDDDAIRPLCIKLPQMIGYVKHFDSNKTMSFQAIDNKLLKKHNKIWEKISNLLNIEFDSEHVYGDGDKYIKTKIKIYEDRVNTIFQGKKVSKTQLAQDVVTTLGFSCILVATSDNVFTTLSQCRVPDVVTTTKK